MEKRKRPCKVKRTIIDETTCRVISKENFNGLFHQWANESKVIHENGSKSIHSVAHTLGIVEDEHGQIHMVKPEDIIFTDK